MQAERKFGNGVANSTIDSFTSTANESGANGLLLRSKKIIKVSCSYGRDFGAG